MQEKLQIIKKEKTNKKHPLRPLGFIPSLYRCFLLNGALKYPVFYEKQKNVMTFYLCDRLNNLLF
jgi:hypothetical protein